VKILESFANRIPVVSTVVGAEGLDLEDGHQLLLAQDAAGFAKACVVGLKDIDLRRRLVAAAEERFRARHQWSTAQARIRDLALATAGAADRSDGQHSDCL
jgi:glycosyltransferase involved in cell wall biosynthesis